MSYNFVEVPGGNIKSSDWNSNFIAVQNTLFIKNEIPAGLINGTTGTDGNPVFTTANPFISGTLEVFHGNSTQLSPVLGSTVITNAGWKCIPGVHYTETGANQFTFIAPYIPISSDSLIVNYTNATP